MKLRSTHELPTSLRYQTCLSQSELAAVATVACKQRGSKFGIIWPEVQRADVARQVWRVRTSNVAHLQQRRHALKQLGVVVELVDVA